MHPNKNAACLARFAARVSKPDDSSQDLQRQPRSHPVFSRGSKEILGKEVAGLICLGSFCASTVFLEYEMLLLGGAAFVIFAAGCALAAISGALYRAPWGDERADGLHIREHNRAEPFSFGAFGRGHLSQQSHNR